MKAWLVIIVGLAISWHYTDISSTKTLANTICPTLVIIFLTGFLIKLVFLFVLGNGQRGHQGDSGGSFGGFGGDAGGGDDGGD